MEANNGNEKSLTPEQLRTIANMVFKHDEELDQFFGIIVNLQKSLIKSGVKLPHAEAILEAAKKRTLPAGILKVERERLRRSMGLA